jgi:hypothetical protein
MAKVFLSLGVLFLLLGGFILLFDKFELFKLPGDIYIQKENFSFYFPITSSILLSILATIVFNIIFRLFK